jgi:hypothetical protein
VPTVCVAKHMGDVELIVMSSYTLSFGSMGPDLDMYERM